MCVVGLLVASTLGVWGLLQFKMKSSFQFVQFLSCHLSISCFVKDIDPVFNIFKNKQADLADFPVTFVSNQWNLISQRLICFEKCVGSFCICWQFGGSNVQNVESWTPLLGPKSMNLKTFPVFGKWKLTVTSPNKMKQNHSTEFLGYSKLKNWSKDVRPDPPDPKSGSFPIFLIEPLYIQ